MSDLQQQLAAAFPQSAHLLLFDVPGAKRPPYNDLSISETLTKFVSEFLPQSPIYDPRSKPVHVVKNNFPKLAGLKHRTLTKEQLPASEIIAAIENGTFKPEDYHDNRTDRLRSIFWLPEVLNDPDAIYENGHKIVEGDEVYVRVYDKMGSKVKVAFTLDIRKKGKIIRTVLVTSFLTDPKTAKSFVKGCPRYVRPKKEEPPEGGSISCPV